MSSPRNFMVIFMAPASVVLVVFAMTIMSVFYVDEIERLDRQLRFEQAAGNRVAAVQRQFELSISALDLVGTFFDADEQVSEAEFEQFVDPVMNRNPAMIALGYAPRVSLENKNSFEEAAASVHMDFRISERHEQGLMIPVHDRPWFTPVRYIVPISGNEAALGFDLASDPKRNAALTLAGRLREIRATAPVVLVQETQPVYSLLMVRPVYVKGAMLDLEKERENALIGYVSAVIRSDELISSALAQLSPAGIDFALTDISDPTRPQILAIHSSRTRDSVDNRPAVATKSKLAHKQLFEAGGRQYLVELSPAPGYFQDALSLANKTLLIVGLSLGVALGLFLWSLNSSGSRLSKSADALRQLSERLIRVQEDERGKLSRELNSEIGQDITALQLNMNELRKFSRDSNADDLLDYCNESMSRVVRQITNIALELRPPMLDDLGLDAALHWYVRGQTERAGLPLKYNFDIGGRRLPKAIETAAYRVIQEMLANVIEESQLSRLEIDVGREKDDLVVRILGVGDGDYDPKIASGQRSELGELHERVKLAGASLDMKKSEYGNKQFVARFPLRHNAWS